MRRTLTAIAAVTVMTLPLIGAAPTAHPDRTEGAQARHGRIVTGTYSTGGTQAWRPLPIVRTGTDTDGPVDATVVADPSALRQQYTGIGFSLDETSVSNLWKLTPAERAKAVRLLVDPEHGAGLDRFRLTIGSPDLIEHLPFWSEDDLPAGVTEDFGLKHFSVQRDLDLHIIDTIKLIQHYNPHATFFASAWSAPAWMKSNNRFLGEVALKPGSSTDYYQVGKLRDDCIDAFARYYVKFVQAYARHGIRVDALTLLNEPGMDVVYPAMDISVAQQQKLALAVKRELRAARLDTQLYVHDFNFWDWHDPNSTATKNYYRIFEDAPGGSVTGAQVRKAADAIAFHPYWGDPHVMRDAYEQTGKPVQLTETSDLSSSTVLDDFRLDAGSYILWAQTTDQDGGTLHWTPSRDNNIDWDQVAATTKWPDRLVTVHTDTKRFTVRDELYELGQFAKYLSPGDVRLESSATEHGVGNVVYRTRNGGYTAVLGNSTGTDSRVRMVVGAQTFVVTVPAGSFATYRWQGQAPTGGRDHAPVFAPAADVVADQYGTTHLQLRATDADGDRPAYYATELPDGVTLDPATGLVTIHPTVTGEQDLTFYATDGRAHDKLTVHLTVRPHAAPVGERIEAESYTGRHGWPAGGSNFVESNSAASGGKDVGWTAAGNWLTYRLEVPQAGSYDLELRVANGTGATAANAVSLRDDTGTTLATASVPATGGWGTYQSVQVPVTLRAGEQTVTVFCETGGFNLDYLRFTVAG
ncbi:glucosylceramidase [Streptomyces sp. Ag109_O5-1]|uniref:carbohydrate-binding protein n=1 Tax=Streptomyces sp. Ag109_O5-1 TaxID=1938851 RepID=UPI000FC1D5DB|nr:carbohydrate-binding protein [Streptomyces sp. Ag109_O5-1]RPE46590.1 glucosylceramidase [Streptomyces sp. Ag109_O5-1]